MKLQLIGSLLVLSTASVACGSNSDAPPVGDGDGDNIGDGDGDGDAGGSTGAAPGTGGTPGTGGEVGTGGDTATGGDMNAPVTFAPVDCGSQDGSPTPLTIGTLIDDMSSGDGTSSLGSSWSALDDTLVAKASSIELTFPAEGHDGGNCAKASFTLDQGTSLRGVPAVYLRLPVLEDLSGSDGLQFYYKGEGSFLHVRTTGVPSSDPHKIVIPPATGWTLYQIPWEGFWQAPNAAADTTIDTLDPSQFREIEFEVSGPDGLSADIWIDDISAYSDNAPPVDPHLTTTWGLWEDFEDGDTEIGWTKGFYAEHGWYSYNDSFDGGLSYLSHYEGAPGDEVDPHSGAAPFMARGIGRGSHSRASAFVYYSLDQGTLMHDPYVGMGVEGYWMDNPPFYSIPPNLVEQPWGDWRLEAEGIRFHHKGSAVTVEGQSWTIVLGNAPESEDWQLVELPFSAGFDVTDDVDHIAFKITGPSGSTGSFWIDDIQFMPPADQTEEVSIECCGSYTWAENGHTYNRPGVYYHDDAGTVSYLDLRVDCE